MDHLYRQIYNLLKVIGVQRHKHDCKHGNCGFDSPLGRMKYIILSLPWHLLPQDFSGEK